MYAKITVLLLFVISVVLCSSQLPPTQDTTTVLFIGDNFTLNNDLPGIFKDIAESLGEYVTLKVFASDGWDLDHHWQDGGVLQEIKTAKWDYIVLQEKADKAYTEGDVYLATVGLFADYIRDVSPKSTIALFLTWADENLTNMQQQVTSTIVNAASIYDALVIPCGPSFFVTPTPPPPLDFFSLWDTDKHNPSVYGSYLCGVVFFTEIFQHSPMNASVSVLPYGDTQVANFLQKVAFSEAASFLPFAPTSLMGNYDTFISTISLLWADSSFPIISPHTFSVERSNGSGFFCVGTTVNMLFSDIITSGTYTYRVRSKNEHGLSLSSNLFQIIITDAASTTSSSTSSATTTISSSSTGGVLSSSTSSSSSTSRIFDVLPGFHTTEEKALIGGTCISLLLVVGIFIWRVHYVRNKIKASKVRFDLIEDEVDQNNN